MNVLLVGLGRWGEKHLRVLTQLGATVWVADGAAARRQWAVAQGVDPERVVADFRHALPHVDAADIVTPADSHRALAEACLAAGRHCFVEKPLAISVTDGRALAAAATAAGRTLQVGHIFRFHPVTATLRAALTAGRIGRVRFATGRFAGFKRPRTDVGVTHTDAIHYFDLFAHLLGREATRVSAVQRDYLGRRSGRHVADHGDVRRRPGHRRGQLLRARQPARVCDRRRARSAGRRLRQLHRRPSCGRASGAAGGLGGGRRG